MGSVKALRGLRLSYAPPGWGGGGVLPSLPYGGSLAMALGEVGL